MGVVVSAYFRIFIAVIYSIPHIKGTSIYSSWKISSALIAKSSTYI
jgi:hypothetical protein